MNGTHITILQAMLSLLGLVLNSLSLAVSNVDQFPSQELVSAYEKFQMEQHATRFPFELNYTEQNGIARTSGRILLQDVSFVDFKNSLSDITQWCEFVPIHLNIKACTFKRQSGNDLIQFYLGNKVYQTPDKASLLELRFKVLSNNNVLMVELTAPDGPFGTSDYRLTLRAIAVNEGVFTEFDLSSRPGYASALISTYFLTLARHKTGFTVVGKTFTGKPKFVRGRRGASERNVVRYLLAFKIYFETAQLPPQQRFEQRIQRWFDATENFHDQLYELPREEYLRAKRKERQNQAQLQIALDQGLPSPFNIPKQRDR